MYVRYFSILKYVCYMRVWVYVDEHVDLKCKIQINHCFLT